MVRPEQVKASPFYWPNLIAALVASVSIIVGSIGPWVAFMGMTKNAIGGDANITLGLGIVAALALFALLNFGRTEVRSKRMVALGVVATVAGVVSCLIALFDAKNLTSLTTEIMGSTIGPEIGWGLWMILIGGPVLAVTSAIVVMQVKTMAKEDPGLQAGVDPLNLPSAQSVLPPPEPSLAPEGPSAPAETPAPTSSWESPIANQFAPVAEPAPPHPPVQTPPSAPIQSAVPATPMPPLAQPPVASGPPVFDYPMTPPEPPAHTGGSHRSPLRRIAPWAGGVAALAAALGTGVWAAPYLTGGNQNTNNSTMPAATKTVTNTAVPSSTMSSTRATSADSPAASGVFGPFDSGDAKVFVDGKPREVRGKVNCYSYDNAFWISLEPPGNPVMAKVSQDFSRVLHVSLGKFNGEYVLPFLDGSTDSDASVTKDGNSYRITGRIRVGYSSLDAVPFEIDVTCP